jgi:hypothetical protein
VADTTRISPVPISGGENLSADPATQATTLVANTSIGPAGENSQRAGLVDTVVTGLGTSPVIGSWPWLGYLVLVTADRKVWALSEGAPTTAVALSDATAATQLPGTARPVFSEDGLPRLVIAGGGAPLQWTGAGLCSPLVTSGHTPAATHIAYLGDRLLANDLSNPTQWYWSDPFDAAHGSWPDLNFDTADASPDPIVGVYSTIREAYVFGEKSLQVYSVGSDPLNPFDFAVAQAIGCAAPYSPVNADGAWLWLDDRRRIVLSDGRQLEDISADLAKVLRGFSTVSDCWSFREDIEQQTYYVFRFPTAGREFVYDTPEKMWMERDYYADTGRVPLPYQSHAYWPAFGSHYFGSTTTGAVYKWDTDTRTDLGQPLVMERVTGWLDHGSNARKRSVRVRARLRRGTGTPTTEELFEVRVADDGGPWGEWEQVPLGVSGENEQIADAYIGGVFRQRRYNFRYSGTAGTALLAVEDHLQDLDS